MRLKLAIRSSPPCGRPPTMWRMVMGPLLKGSSAPRCGTTCCDMAVPTRASSEARASAEKLERAQLNESLGRDLRLQQVDKVQPPLVERLLALVASRGRGARVGRQHGVEGAADPRQQGRAEVGVVIEDRQHLGGGRAALALELLGARERSRSCAAP